MAITAQTADFRVRKGIVVENTATILSTLATTSTNSGALQVAGGAGIAGGLFVGGTVTATLHVGNLTGTATTATNIASGATGSIPIQSAAGTTAFIPLGTNGYVLTAGSNTATWTAISGLSAGSATTATNLAGGTAGQVPYQSAVGSTAFTGPGTAGTLLVSNGTSGPSFTNQVATLIVTSTQSSTSSYSSNALYVAGGIGGNNGFNINGDGYLTGNLYVTGIITGTNVLLNTLVANSGTFYGDATGSGALYAGITNFTPFAQTMFQASGNLNNYMEVNVQNINPGAKASTDIVASADNVSLSSAYIDMGIASSTFDGTQLYSLGTTIGPNDGYLMVGQNATAGVGDLVFGTLTSGTQMRFVLANGTTSTVTNAAIAVVMNTPNTPATSTATGTMVVYGGVGISGNAYIGGNVTATNFYGNVFATNTATIMVGLATTATYAQSFNTATLVANAVTASTATNAATAYSTIGTLSTGTGILGSSFNGSTNVTLTLNTATLMALAVTATYAQSFNTATLVANAVNAYTATWATTATYALAFNTATLVANAVTAFTATWATTATYAQAFNTATLVANAVNAVTATNANNITGGAQGSIPIQSAAGTTAYIPLGSSGYVLTAGSTTATWQALGSLTAGTATNANNILTAAQTANADYYPTLVSTNNATAAYQSEYTTSSFSINPSTGIVSINGGLTVTGSLTSTNHIINGTTAASSTNTGALQVAGGVGIAGGVFVGGTVTATNFYGNVYASNTATIMVGLATTATFAQSFNTATLVANAVTAFTSTWATTATYALAFNTATLVANAVTASTATNAATAYSTIGTLSTGTGILGSSFNGSTNVTLTLNTATLMALAVTANNISGGATGSIPIQSAAGTTAYIPLGNAGYVLTAGATTATWTAVSGLSAGTATNANNILTAAQPANTTYYPTFVSANNATAAYQSEYTTSSFSINAATGNISIGGTVTGAVNGTGGTAFLAGNGAYNNIALGMQASSGPANMAIRDLSTVSSIMYFDSSVNAAQGGQFIFRATSGFTSLMVLNTTSSTISVPTLITSTALSTTTTTGALVVSGGIGLGGNIITAGYGQFAGAFNESTTQPGVFIGISGSGTPSPRAGFFNGNTAQNWEIDNYSGAFRWFTPGVTRMQLDTSGNLTVYSTSATNSTSSGALVVSGGVGIGGGLNVGGTAYIAGDLYVDGTQFVVNKNVISSGDSAIILSTGSTTALLAINSGLYIGASSSTAYASFYFDGVANWVVGGTAATGLKSANHFATSYSSVGSYTSTQKGEIFSVNGGVYVNGIVTATTVIANVTGNVTGNLTGTATTATNIASGATGSIPIQSAAGTTAFIPLGNAGYVLTAGATTATWTAVSGLSAGTATNANNVLTVAQTGNASYYPVFVSSNNATAGYQSEYTTSSFYINAATGAINVGGSLQVASGNPGGVYIGTHGQIFDDGNFHIHSISDGNLWINNASTTSNTDVRINNQSTGSVILTNGVGNVRILSTQSSNSATSGALQVTGGVGIGGGLFVGGVVTATTFGSSGALNFNINSTTLGAAIDTNGNFLLGGITSPIAAVTGGSVLQIGSAASQLGSANNPYAFANGKYSTAAGVPQYTGNWASGNWWAFGPDTNAADTTLRLGVATVGTSGFAWQGAYANLKLNNLSGANINVTGVVTATTFYGTFIGTLSTIVSTASTVVTLATTNNALYYPTFVNTLNTSTTAGQAEYTTSSFTINPGNGAVTFTGSGYFAGSAGSNVGTGSTTSNTAYSLTLQRVAGSNGNLIVQGDDTVVGSPNITFLNTRTTSSAVMSWNGTAITVNTSTAINGVAASTSTNTGALTVAGGVGIGGGLFVGGITTSSQFVSNGGPSTLPYVNITGAITTTSQIFNLLQNSTPYTTAAGQVTAGLLNAPQFNVNGNSTIYSFWNQPVILSSTATSNVSWYGIINQSLRDNINDVGPANAIYGIYSQSGNQSLTSSSAYTSAIVGMYSQAIVNQGSAGALYQFLAGGNATGVAANLTSNTSSVITNSYAFYSSGGGTIGSASTVTVVNSWGMYLGAPTVSTYGSITNRWGISQADALAANSFLGYTGIGYASTTSIAGEKLAVNGSGYFNGVVTATNFYVNGYAVSTGTGNASGVTVQATATNATYYPVFVSVNTATAQALPEYTTSTFSINPSTGSITVGSTATTTAANVINSAIWEKLRFVNATTTSTARVGSDGNGLNLSTNAVYGGPWAQDTNLQKSLLYIQHLGNGRHEFRTAPANTSTVNWVYSLVMDDNTATFSVPVVLSATTASVSTTTGALTVAGGVGVGGALYAGSVYAGGTQLLPNSIQTFTAAANTTTFAISGGYVVGQIQVFVNGISLSSVAGDFTASNGSTVVLATPRNAGDVVQVISQQSFNPSGQQAYIFNQYTSNGTTTTFATNYNTATVQVYQNGVLQYPTTYTANNGTSIVFSSIPSNGTVIGVISFNSVSIANAISSSGGTIQGNLNVAGSLQQNGQDITAFATAMAVAMGI